jgi:hypothetical protein
VAAELVELVSPEYQIYDEMVIGLVSDVYAFVRVFTHTARPYHHLLYGVVAGGFTGYHALCRS